MNKVFYQCYNCKKSTDKLYELRLTDAPENPEAWPFCAVRMSIPLAICDSCKYVMIDRIKKEFGEGMRV